VVRCSLLTHSAVSHRFILHARPMEESAAPARPSDGGGGVPDLSLGGVVGTMVGAFLPKTVWAIMSSVRFDGGDAEMYDSVENPGGGAEVIGGCFYSSLRAAKAALRELLARSDHPCGSPALYRRLWRQPAAVAEPDVDAAFQRDLAALMAGDDGAEARFRFDGAGDYELDDGGYPTDDERVIDMADGMAPFTWGEQWREGAIDSGEVGSIETF